MFDRRASFLFAVLLAGCANANAPGPGLRDLGHSGGGGDLTSVHPPDLGGAPPDLLPAADLLDSDGGLGMDDGGGGDALPPGKDPGEVCAADAECASQLCKAVVAKGSKVCVAPCGSQADCVKLGISDLFCEPISVGSAKGYCIPHSPTHCNSCVDDSDCGGLTERCLQGPGDIAKACHIDCSLAGAAACPPEYTCDAVTDGMTQRKLCMPPKMPTPYCLDSLGGYCDRVTLPQPCARTNMAGICTGERVCLTSSKRYGKCNALAPQFKKSCSDQDPAGCTVGFDPKAAMDKQNCGVCGNICGGGADCCGGVCIVLSDSYQHCGACGHSCAPGENCCGGACVSIVTAKSCGACGNTCPGYGLSTAEAQCVNASQKQCGLTCRGENYDVNKDPADGCEKLHETPPGHTQQSAGQLGALGSCDSDTKDFTAHLFSDSRVHDNPKVDGFNGTIGSAPDHWSVVGTGAGKLCQNDYGVTFTTSGGGNTPCYKCTIITNKLSDNVVVTGNGSKSMSQSGAGKYSNGSTIFFVIEKICTLPVQEAVTYKVHFHL